MLQSTLFPLIFCHWLACRHFLKIFVIVHYNNLKEIHFAKNEWYIYKQVSATCVTFHDWKNLFVVDSVSEEIAALIALTMEVAGTLVPVYMASQLRRQQSSKFKRIHSETRTYYVLTFCRELSRGTRPCTVYAWRHWNCDLDEQTVCRIRIEIGRLSYSEQALCLVLGPKYFTFLPSNKPPFQIS